MPSPYIIETLDLLGDQDPIAVLSDTPAWIANHIEGLSEQALTQPEGPGRWSLAEVLAHLADAEVAFGWRARIMLTQDQPPLQGFDETAWMTRFDCASADSTLALQTFSHLRRWNLRVWSCATDADLERVGMHQERGPETFGFVRRLVAGHDLRHRRQISRILKVVH
jgi:uncharacterized damage-inducible protein DinB